jgi:glutamate racemase
MGFDLHPASFFVTMGKNKKGVREMALAEDYIAVFDSGVGGISVLCKLLRIMPNERYLYFGDSANAPYGTRSREEVVALTLATVERLKKRGVKAFVIACNTATSTAYEIVKEQHPDTIVVGIEPALAQAAEKHPGGTVGVLATPRTLAGERFKASQARYADRVTSIPLPAPGLVELVEAELGDSPQTDELLRKILGPHIGKLDALLLGCTHYPFARNSIRRVLGPDVDLLDGAVVTAEETKRALEQAGLLYRGPGELTLENSIPGDRLICLYRRLMGLE